MRKNKQTTYNLSQDSIRTIQQQAYEEARREFSKKRKDDLVESFAMTLSIFMLFLRDEYKFGEKRIARAVEKFVELHNDWSAGSFNTDDVIEAIEDETGYKLEFNLDLNNRKINLK